MVGVDYSFARYTAAQLKARGVDVAFRYLRGAGKAITKVELDTLVGGGILVCLCDEVQPTDATGTGTVRAQAINEALAALGLPTTTPVYAAADTRYTSLEAPLRHFEQVASVRGPHACGVYGEGALCQAARAAGYVAFTWQSAAQSFPGNGSTLPTTDVQQGTTVPPLPTTDVDRVVQQRDFGQIPRPVIEENNGMKPGIHTDPASGAQWLVWLSNEGLRRAHIPAPMDVIALQAMGAVPVKFNPATFEAIIVSDFPV